MLYYNLITTKIYLIQNYLFQTSELFLPGSVYLLIVKLLGFSYK